MRCVTFEYDWRALVWNHSRLFIHTLFVVAFIQTRSLTRTQRLLNTNTRHNHKEIEQWRKCEHWLTHTSKKTYSNWLWRLELLDMMLLVSVKTRRIINWCNILLQTHSLAHSYKLCRLLQLYACMRKSASFMRIYQ